jgi:hypothetical protein
MARARNGTDIFARAGEPSHDLARRASRLALVIGVLLVARGASASFTPVVPATCPATTEVNWSYNLSAAGQCTGAGCPQDAGWMIPANPNLPTEYTNSVQNFTLVAGNEYINQFGFRINTFETEPNYDFLTVWNSTSTISLTGGANWGNPIQGWRDLPATHTSLPTDSTAILFNSDYSVSQAGIFLDRARVCTNNPGMALQNAERAIGPVFRTSGVLLGTNDVVYFTVPVGSMKSGDSCSSAHDTFALWGDPTPGNDFDLYVRCGAQPTPLQYDYRGFSSDTQEFVHATTASCPCGSQWHIAVHAFHGSGWFNLVNHKHYASEHRGDAGVNVECGPVTSDVIAQYQQQMSIGFKHFFGANEGARYWDSITLHNAPGGGGIQIDACPFDCTTGRPHSDVCSSGLTCLFTDCFVQLYCNWFDGPTLSHELGHHINCLQDEYEDSQGTECGHSIMGSQFLTNTNYCWCNNQVPGQNKCGRNGGDHGWDPSPNTLTSLKTGTAWTNLQSRAPFSVMSTPDNYDYTQFDFNNLYGVVTVQPN